MEQLMEHLLAEMKVIQHKMDAIEHKRKPHHEEMMAKMDAWRGKTEAFLEKKEPTPEGTEAIEKSREVPEEATDEETFGATEDRAGEQRMAVRRHGQLKKQDSGQWWTPAEVCRRPRTVYSPRSSCTAQGTPAKRTRPGIRQRVAGKEHETGSQRRCGTSNPERTDVREETADAAEMQQWNEGPGHETAATYRKREDIHRSPRTDFRSGSHGADSQIFD
jgi:hypothetical protein